MVNVDEWLNGIPSEPGGMPAIRHRQFVRGQTDYVSPAWGQRHVEGQLHTWQAHGTHSLGTHSRNATDDTAFSEGAFL